MGEGNISALMQGTNEISSKILFSIPAIHLYKALIKLSVNAERPFEISGRLESLRDLSGFFLVQTEAQVTMIFCDQFHFNNLY